MIKKEVMAAYQLKSEHEILKKRVMKFRQRLMDFCDTLNEPVPEHTGLFVLLKKDSNGDWSCVGFYNSDSKDEDVEPEWTVALPIPKPESIDEFRGW